MITITIERLPRSDWFITRCADLPGLMLAAPTIELLEQQIPRALRMLAPGVAFRVRRDAVRRAAIKSVA